MSINLQVIKILITLGLFVVASCNEGKFSVGQQGNGSSTYDKETEGTEETEETEVVSPKETSTVEPDEEFIEEYSTAVPPQIITGAYLVCEQIDRVASSLETNGIPESVSAGEEPIFACGVQTETGSKHSAGIEVKSSKAVYDDASKEDLVITSAGNHERWHTYFTVPIFENKKMASLELDIIVDGNELVMETQPFLTPDHHILFITSTFYAPGGVAPDGFSSLEDADAVCDSLGKSVDIGARGWRAIMSDEDEAVRDRIFIKSRILNAGLEELWKPNDNFRGGFFSYDLFSIDENIEYDEKGEKVSSDEEGVWTGTTRNAGISNSNCNNWTSNSNEDEGQVGDFVDQSDSDWFSNETKNCDSSHRIYCMNQW